MIARIKFKHAYEKLFIFTQHFVALAIIIRRLEKKEKKSKACVRNVSVEGKKKIQSTLTPPAKTLGKKNKNKNKRSWR